VRSIVSVSATTLMTTSELSLSRTLTTFGFSTLPPEQFGLGPPKNSANQATGE
jgi:hypothetical protein